MMFLTSPKRRELSPLLVLEMQVFLLPLPKPLLLKVKTRKNCKPQSQESVAT